MVERYPSLPDSIHAVVFGRSEHKGKKTWAAIIGEVTIYSKTDIHMLNKAIMQDHQLRAYPYGPEGSIGKLTVKPLLPGRFLDISFTDSDLYAKVRVADFVNPKPEEVPIYRGLLGTDEGVYAGSSFMLHRIATRRLYEISLLE